MHPEKSSLSIRLTEQVVALRGTSDRAFRHQCGEVFPPAIVRGLITLKLTNPTKISRIELELVAKATTHYPRGAGPHRIDLTEQYKVHSASMVVFKAGSAPQVRPRATSARPTNKVQFLDGVHAVQDDSHSRHWHTPSDPYPVISRSASLDPRSLRVGRQESQILIDPAPPYPGDFLPSVAGRSLSVASSSGITRPLSYPVLSRGSPTPDIPYGSPTSSEHSKHDFTHSHPSDIEEVPEDENESIDACTHPDNLAYYGLSRVATSSPCRSSERDPRGRSHSRFSLGKIVHTWDMVKDRVRSRSPQAGSQQRSDEQEERGRSLAKGKGKAQVGTYDVRRVLPQIGVSEPLVANDQSGDGWVMFPKGTYTYPIFFTISNKSPPTMKADHGSLIWNVKVEVRRPDVFQSNMTAQKEVIVVCLMKDDNREEVEGIDLQKQWENQIHYRIQIVGRSFPVGGMIPFQLTITPLAKIKVYCISVYLEERMKYYTRAGTQARSDTIRHTMLLVIRHDGFGEWYSEPILPLISDEQNAFRGSPLYRFLNPGEDESEVASSFMGPGPWTIRHQLKVPNSCSVLHPSNQTKGSNVMVDHTLRMTLRVEREEETGTVGKKKLYDIIIHLPIQILSCRCTSEWTSLPQYDEMIRSEGDSPEDMSICPCRARSQAKARTHSQVIDALPILLERVTRLPITSSNPSSASTDTFPSDSLISYTHLHEQLMSGLVSERGEAPPSYERFEADYA